MAEQSDVKVFISWSGSLAKDVAVALREWLPLLFDRVAPWASDTDIAAGQRGLAQIEAELTNTRFGIVIVTAANQHAPWLNFEAGALSKTVTGDVEHRVVPLLVDLTGPTQLTGPLAQFQAKNAQRTGVLDMVRSLAAVAGIEDRVAAARFDAYWPQLEAKIEAAKTAAPEPATQQAQREEGDVLDEILLHVRALRSDAAAPVGRRLPHRSDQEDAGFHQFLDELADRHNMLVDTYPEPLGARKRKVVLRPKGKWSPEDVNAFTQDLRNEAAPGDTDIMVTHVPF